MLAPECFAESPWCRDEDPILDMIPSIQLADGLLVNAPLLLVDDSRTSANERFVKSFLSVRTFKPPRINQGQQITQTPQPPTPHEMICWVAFKHNGVAFVVRGFLRQCNSGHQLNVERFAFLLNLVVDGLKVSDKQVV